MIKDRFKEEGKEHPFPLTYNHDDLQRIVIELKLKQKKYLYTAGTGPAIRQSPILSPLTLETVIEEGLKQTSSYVNKTGVKEAYLIIFDQENPNWEDKLFVEKREYNSYEITVFGM